MLLQTRRKETIAVRLRGRQNSSDIKVRNLVTGQELEDEAVMYRPLRVTS